MTYPTVAPYSGQISAQRAAAGGTAADTAKSGNESGIRPAQGSDQTGNTLGASNGAGAKHVGVRDVTARPVKNSSKTKGSTPSVTGWTWVAVGLVLVALILMLAAWRFGWLGGPSQMSGGILLLTQLKNATGDSRLGAVILQGLEIDLLESNAIAIRGPQVFGAEYRRAGIAGDASPERLNEIAARAGATHYIAGEITSAGSEGPYTVSIDLIDIANNRKLVQIKETVENKSGLVMTIDSVATKIRSAMGESRDSISQADVPLATEATRNLDALASYFQGQAALQQGMTTAALAYFERAVSLDAGFALAEVRLAALYREQLSELRSAAAARQAAAAKQTSERVRMLAQFRNAVDSDGDLETGLLLMQRFIQLYPRDAEGPKGLAEVLRMEGRFTEALQAAQQASALDPFDVEIYWQMERAMLCLNRFDGIGQIETTMQGNGLASGPDALLAYHLSGKRTELEREVAIARSSMDDTQRLARYAFYLDDEGRLGSGEAVWRGRLPSAGIDGDKPIDPTTLAAQATARENIAAIDAANGSSAPGPNPAAGLDSSKASLLAQAALNRALTGDCRTALGLLQDALAQPSGPRASFNAGMAAALCGDSQVATASLTEIERSRTLSTAAREYMVPDLKAAIALHAGDASAALGGLQATGTYDLVSLTPYLRGLAHTALSQPGLAIADFEAELTHRGATAVGKSTVYVMAEIQIARAYEATGDRTSATAAYSRFLRLWKDADAGQRLVAEARSHVH
jgi:serine/threonine-protein kinase